MPISWKPSSRPHCADVARRARPSRGSAEVGASACAKRGHGRKRTAIAARNPMSDAPSPSSSRCRRHRSRGRAPRAGARRRHDRDAVGRPRRRQDDARARMLRALGWTGPVKSPTYTLVEHYPLSSLYFYHFDFYRFADPSEWETAGLAECFRADAVCLVEWPERVAGCCRRRTSRLTLAHPADPSRAGRELALSAHTERGERCLAAMIARSTRRRAALTAFRSSGAACASGCCCPRRSSSSPALAWASVGAHRVRARVARAGIHARHPRVAGRRSRISVLTLTDPHRLVLDLEGVELTPELAQLADARAGIRSRTSPAIRFGTPSVRRCCASCSTSRREVEAAGVRAEAGGRIRPSASSSISIR